MAPPPSPPQRPGFAAGVTWRFGQVFGERAPGEEVQDADLISAVEFDEHGEYLATGDHGGRVVLFERLGREQERDRVRGAGSPVPSSPGSPDRRPPPASRDPDHRSHPARPLEYRYLTEFQSHEPEFDYLKSLEIEERINAVRWVRREAGSAAYEGSQSHLILSANDRTIKLWKVQERSTAIVAKYDDPPPGAPTATSASAGFAPGAYGGGSPAGHGPDPAVTADRPAAARAGNPAASPGSPTSPSASLPSSPFDTVFPSAGPSGVLGPGSAPATAAAPGAGGAASPGRQGGGVRSGGGDARAAAEAAAATATNGAVGAGHPPRSPRPPTPGAGPGSGAGSGGAEAPSPPPPPPPAAALLRLPRVVRREQALTHRCRRTFGAAHAYHINSLSVCADRETILSADDLRVNLWHLDHPDGAAWNVVDIKPAAMEDLVEVITHAGFHPTDPASLAYATSRGAIRLADLRASSRGDGSPGAPGSAVLSFVDPGDVSAPKTFFSEIVASVNDLAFLRDGRHLLSRDYMTVKLWDVANPSRPCATYPVHEPLRAKLCDLYESDHIFDKFDVSVRGDGTYFATGTYGGLFRVGALGDPSPPAGGGARPDSSPGPSPARSPVAGGAVAAAGASLRGPPGPWAGTTALLEASRDPTRRRAAAAAAAAAHPKAGRYGVGAGQRGSSGTSGLGGRGASLADMEAAISEDFSSKILRLSVHPDADVIATAAANSLYLFQGSRERLEP